MILFIAAALSLLAALLPASTSALNVASHASGSNNRNSLNAIPVTNPQMTIQELLASQGFGAGQQVAILVIAPQNLANLQGLLGSGQQQQQYQQQASASFGRGFGGQQAGSDQILVEAPAQPVSVHYKSQSIPLNVQHTHIPAPTPEVKLTSSQEEPHKIIHEIIRPVIQEVREIIQPYRRIIQEIRPVEESVVSQVATSSKQGKPGSAASTTLLRQPADNHQQQ